MAQNRNQNPAFILISDVNLQGLAIQITQALAEGYVLYGTHSAVFDGHEIYWSQSVVLPQSHPDYIHANPRRGGNKSSKQRKNLY